MSAPRKLPANENRPPARAVPPKSHRKNGIQFVVHAGVIAVSALHIRTDQDAGDPGAQAADDIGYQNDIF